MRQKRSLLPGWTLGATSARDTSDPQVGPAPRGARLLLLLLRPTAPPLKRGLLVAVSLVVAETLVLYPLKQLVPVRTLGIVYLFGVLVVAVVWGFWLAAATSMASVLAFDYFHVPPIYSLSPTQGGDWVAITTFLVAALLASTLADLARSRAAEASQRRKELARLFDLSAEMLCIGGSQHFTRVNPAFERALGYTRQDLLSRPFLDMIHPADRQLVAEVLDDLTRHPGPVHLEDRCICKDGSVRWLEWNVVADHGVLYGAARDVTERRREQDELRVLADQQASLRRVATLVARGVDPSEMFSAVAAELAQCLGAHNAGLLRYEPDGAILVAANQELSEKMPVGTRLAFEGETVAERVFRTRLPARMDSHDNAQGRVAAYIGRLGIRSSVGAPIIVGGHVWGAAIIGSTQPEPLPPDTEARIGDFTDLVATAIANAATRAELQASREELHVLAEQQAALRRVATLVARGVDPSEVFSAVADELAHCSGVYDHAVLFRYEPHGTGVLLAAGSDDPELHKIPVGERFSLAGESVAARVFRTGRPARMDSYKNAPGSIATRFRELGLRTAVGAPIIVEGRLWGTAIVGSTQSDEPLPPDTEAHISDFADLVATAIANAATRAELTASRARIVAAADDARRRIERDLHDGSQQRLVSIGLRLRATEAAVPSELPALREQISDVIMAVSAVATEMQEITRGIHPAVLSRGGLVPALRALARRSTVPVDLDLHVDRRLPESAEVTAYYVVAEALTNTAKHARASEVTVCVELEGANLHLSIRDDGVGGADTAKGSGLIGLTDRVEALGGQMKITSDPGGGTSLLVEIPLEIQ